MPSFIGPDHRHLPAGEPAAGRHGLPRRLRPRHRPVGPGRPGDDRRHRQLHVTVNTPLPDTPYNVGPDGLLGNAADDDRDSRPGPGPDRRPGGQRLEPLHRPAQPRSPPRGRRPRSSSTRRRPDRHRRRPAPRLAGHVGHVTISFTVEQEHRPEHPQRQLDLGGPAPAPTASSAPPTTSRSRSTGVSFSHHPAEERAAGARADQLHPPRRPGQRPVRGRPPRAGRHRDHRHRRQPAQRLGHAGHRLRLTVRGRSTRRLAPHLRRAELRHRPDGGARVAGEPVPDDQAGDRRRGRSATSWPSCPASTPRTSS